MPRLRHELMVAGLGEGWGEGIVREFGVDMDTLLYFKGITNKDLLDSTGNSAQYSVITLWSPGRRMGEGTVREFGMDMNTLLYLKWMTSEVILHSTGNSAQWYVVAWRGGEFGGEWIHIYLAESLPCSPETITQYCQSAIFQYKKV